VYCYSNSRDDDDMTARLRGVAHGWRTIVDVSDADADAMIRRDGIDILVDLAGHSAGNRLPLFALKPAPVQAIWLGYLDTSGLVAMDYFLTDRFVVPVEKTRDHSPKRCCVYPMRIFVFRLRDSMFRFWRARTRDR